MIAAFYARRLLCVARLQKIFAQHKRFRLIVVGVNEERVEAFELLLYLSVFEVDDDNFGVLFAIEIVEFVVNRV